MNEQFKKISSIILIVAMIITNNGMMVLADNVDSIVDQSFSAAQETPNYYYNDESTTVEEYQEYLESENPEVFDEKETSETEQSKSFDVEENISEEETNETKETSESAEITEAEITGSEEKDVEEEKEEKEEKEESVVATDSDAEEMTEQIEVEEEDVATSSEAESEDVTSDIVATELEALFEEEFNVENIATESDINKVIATESELDENIATNSEITEKEIIVATISKVSWKVKKVLIATFASINVKAKETEKDRLARLATYANVIIVNDKGDEKIFKVNLKWKLLKKYDVNAKSDKQETPIPKEEWRKTLKVDDFIKEQEEVVTSTRSIAVVEERVKEENQKFDDKEYVVKYQIDSSKEETKGNNVLENMTEESAENVETTVIVKETEEVTTVTEETTTETIVEEATVEGFNNTDDIATSSNVENNEEEEIKEEPSEEDYQEVDNQEVESQETESQEEEIATTSIVEEENLSVDVMTINGEEISDDTIGYYDLQTIYLYKVDVPALGDEIIEIISKENFDEEEDKDETDLNEEKQEGILNGFMKLFGIGETASDEATKDEETKEDNLEKYLENAQVDIIEESEVEPMVVEFDVHLLGSGATHDQHQISAFVNGTVLTPDNIFNSVIGGDESDMLDLSENNRRIKATGSNIFIAGTYYLPSDIKISNQWIVEKNNTLTLCLNGHNVKFATAGCVKGEGRVVVCNCGGNATVSIDGPTYNWHDKWYASTSETYTKWNEHSLFSGEEVGVYAKDNNITFANVVIKNQYNGRKAAGQMENTEIDEAELSGDGSILWGKKELQAYGIKFTNNRATRSNGVAANAQLGKMTLENCTFTNNINLTNRGGAVAFNPKATVIYDCVFKDNISFTNGGALYGRSYTNSVETTEIGTRISKTTFENNIALIDGGAIFMDYLCEKGVTIEGTEANKVVFKNNYAGVSGGAISVKHMRSVEGQEDNAYSYEDPTSRGRLLNINHATFEGNEAKSIVVDRNTGAMSEKPLSNKENFGGAISLNSQTVEYRTFPTDRPIKEVNIKNSTFKNNIAKGFKLDIKAKDVTGNFVGETLATYYVGNAGGAIYANKLDKINIEESEFTDNNAMTGANLCIKEATVSFIGGKLSNGKAYNNSYSAAEFYKRVISPGGGAAYLMNDAHISISKETKIETNENAFYLDGGSIDLGAGTVTGNTGEYLIGYANYKSNRILFSGVDIKDHTFNEMRKDYTSTRSDAATGKRNYKDGYYQTSYISFKGTNLITNNKRNFYTKTGTTYTSKNEEANIVMTASDSNLQMDLSQYLFDVPFTDQDVSKRIGLYYDFEPDPNKDQITAYDRWTYENVKVIDEGGLWTNYFEIDNSSKGEWAEGWKFYIEKNEIRMSPHIVQVKFDSYIENVPRIRPQFYNFRKVSGQTLKIATPTEIVRRDIKTPGKTLLGFLGVDKSKDIDNTKYDIWDFDKCEIDPSKADGDVIEIILVYTDDTVKIKPCGCENGKDCVHDGISINHADRGVGTSEDENRYLNYIEVATYPQLAYKYKGRKTQYVLSKDLNITGTQAKQYIDGGMVLNLNGKTLTYDTRESNDSHILDTTGTDVMYEANDSKVMICGIATPGAVERGKIVANGTHKGAFIFSNTDVYLSYLDVMNVSAIDGSDKAFIQSANTNINTYVNTKEVTFSNINLKSDLINAGSKVVLSDTKISNSALDGSVVKIRAEANKETALKLLNTEITGLSKANALLDTDLTSPTGTKVNISTSSITNSVFETQLIRLDDSTTGANSEIKLQGKVKINGNTLSSGQTFIANAATNGNDQFGVGLGDRIEINNNTLPHNDDVTLLSLHQKSITFKGDVSLTGNKTVASGRATQKVSAVKAGNDTSVLLDEVGIRVTDNLTKYEWYAENTDGTTQTFDKPIFTQVTGTKLKASDSIIKIRLAANDEDESQKIYENWSANNIIGEKEAEATFLRDESYSEDDVQDIYKKGKDEETSDIYMGSSYVAVRYRLYNYKANVDERLDATAGYTQAAIQRVEPDVYTLLDTPQYKFDFSRTSVMWEAFAYRNSDGTYDYTEERLYPEKTTHIGIRSTKSVLVSGYIYNYNNKRHVHEGNIELWTEARNEGHLQATNSFVFLHNDLEITRPLKYTPEKTYYLCLNGHKLIVNNSIEWFKSSTCKLIICDCQKTGSIVQNSGEIASKFINISGGEIDINDITIGPFKNVKNTEFINVAETVKVNIDNVEVKEINMDNSVKTDNAFIKINTNNLASVSNITFKSNKILSNDKTNSIFAIDNKSGGSINIDGISLESNEVNADTAKNVNGAGYVVSINGYDRVTLNSPIIKSNKVVLGAPMQIIGNTAAAAYNKTLTMNNVTFEENQKNFVNRMNLAEQARDGISANYASTNFNNIIINGGSFKGNRFNSNAATLASDDGAAIDITNYDANLTIKNVTFDGTGTTANENVFAMLILDKGDDLFENVTITNYNMGSTAYMLLAKGSTYSPAGSYVGRTTFRGTTKFTNNKAKSIIRVENLRADLNNDNEGLLSINGTTFTNNTIDTSNGIDHSGLIEINSNTVTVASGANITKTNGIAINIATSEFRMFNSEISGGLGNEAAVYVKNTGRFVIGDKVIVKDNKINIYLDGDGSSNAQIKAMDGHPISATSEIYITVPDIEYNFFNQWGNNYIKNYNYHQGNTYAYLPNDLFKLDNAIAGNRKIYLKGDIALGNQELWVSSNQATLEYAILIFFDKDIKGPKEIARQYIKVGQRTKLDRVQVDYISTLSQVWMTEADGANPEEQTMWRLYSNGQYHDFEVVNYEAGKTYYAYLTKKHIHKICGPDSLVSCGPNHADGIAHTVDYEFLQVGTSDNIIVEASRSNYIGLSNNLTITQEALDSISNRDIVFCINGYTLTFEKDATLNTNYNFTFVNCESTGVLTVVENEKTSKPLINASGTGNTFSLYNINFQNFETEAPVVKVQNAKTVSENVTFTKIKTTALNGAYDIQSGTVYFERLAFTDNIASGSTLLDLRFGNFTVGKIGDIKINNNSYTNKLLSLSGTGNMDSIVVNNNTMIEGGGADSYGAIYVANGANITYANDAVISANDSSVNEESKGGALTVYGRLNFNGKMTLEDNKAGNGGAIYVDSTGSLNVTGEAYFRENEAKVGAAIYAKNWSNINFSSVIYDGNRAKTHGVVAFGGNYNRGVATYKNHTRSSRDLIYNINDNGTDSITLDKDTLFVDNTLADSIVYLRNVSSANVEISYLSTGNSVKSFVEVATGSIAIDNSVITENTFNDSVFIFKNPVSARVASISVYDNKITNAVLNVSGGAVEIGNKMTFRDNVARLGKTKELYVSGMGGYFKAIEKITMGKKYLFSAYTNGIKVFEKWNNTYIENYDNPQNKEPGRYMVTPENSDTIKLSDDDKDRGLGFYKVGSTNNQDVYIGKEGVDFIQLRFIDPEKDDAVFASQNLEKGKETKLDKVDTLECDLAKQKWVATMSDRTAKTLIFTSTQTASSSDTINILYNRPHLHKICGISRNETCSHTNGANHTEIEYQIVANAAEFATTTNQYVYINDNITVDSTINLASGIRGICLNGYTIKITGGTNSLFNTNNELSICNCKPKGGITTSDAVQEATLINYTGTNLAVYNVDFFGINTSKSVIKLPNTGTATLYTENLRFRNNKDLGYDTVIDSAGNNTIYLNNASFVDNKNESDNNMLDIDSGYIISTLSFINNDTHSRLMRFCNSNLVNVKSLIVKNNKVADDSMLAYVDSGAKINVANDVLFENNTVDGEATLAIDSRIEFAVLGTMSFINNVAKKHAAMSIEDNTIISARNMLFDGNKNLEANNAIVEWSESTLRLDNVVFKNHTNASDILLGNQDNNGTSKIYLSSPSFINNKGIAIKLDGVEDGSITGIKLTKDLNNNFTNVLNIRNSTVSITDFVVKDNSLVNSAVVVSESDKVEFNGIEIDNNIITTNGASALLVNGNGSILKVKGLIRVDNNTRDISLSDNAYLKASGVVDGKSKMSFAVNGTSQKVFEGWNKNHIETFGAIASKSNPKKYTYTPENSGIFEVKSPSGYAIYKGGTGDNVSVYAGNKDSYSVLSFIYVDEDYVESILDTQNVIKGATAIDTLLDVVDTFEYELEHQTWYAPNATTGAHDVKWEFKDEVISNINNDAQIKYVRKHIHRVCGTKYEDACDHKETDVRHANTVIYVDATSSNPIYWPRSAEYINLLNDIEFNSRLDLENLKGICLNGYKIIVGNMHNNFMSISSELNICDCKHKKTTNGAITIKNGVTLQDSLIYVGSGGTFNAYNVNFENISLKDNVDFTTTYTFAIENSNNGTVYLERPVFRGPTEVGENGLLKNRGGASQFKIIEALITDVTLNSPSPLLTLTRNFNISTISVIKNHGYTVPLIKVTDDASVGSFVLSNNSGSTGQGLISIDEGVTLTLTENNMFEGNESQGGGVIKVAGTLVAEKDLTFKDNVTVKGSGNGGALYVTTTGKVMTKGKTKFIGNEAMHGSAIYAENITEDALKDLNEPYFETNTAITSGVVYWSGALRLSTPTIVKHEPYNKTTLKGVRSGIFVNEKSGDKLILDNPIFVDNNIVGNDDSASAIKLHGVVDGSRVVGFDEKSTNNSMNDLIFIEDSGMKISGKLTGSSLNNNFKENVISIKNAGMVLLEDVCIEEQTVGNAALNVSGAPIFVNGEIRIASNKKSENVESKNIFLTDELAHLIASGKEGAVSYISDSSVMDISTAGQKEVRVFEGWNEYNFEHYDKPYNDSNENKYMYTPENSKIFAVGKDLKDNGYEFFKKGYAGDGDGNGDIFLGTDEKFVKLKYYNDVEEVEDYEEKDGDKEYYANQNIAKDVPTKLDKIDSQEYEIEKQEWYVGYQTKDTYDHLEKFNPANPQPTIAGVNGVVETFSTNQEIKYHQFHIHKICGQKLNEECKHEGHSEHVGTVEFNDVNTIEELEAATGYAVLVKDLDIANMQRALRLNSGLTGICLNGHTIMGDGRYGLMNIDHAFTICDCKLEKRDGGITSDESFTQAFDVININTSEEVGIYRVRIKDIAFAAGYAVNAEQGNVYIGSLVIRGCKRVGSNGVIRANTNVAIDQLKIDENNISVANPILRINDRMRINKLLAHNNEVADSIVVVDADTTINCIEATENKSLNKGVVSINAGKTLTIKEQELVSNESRVGGALYVAGSYVSTTNGLGWANNKASEKGGAIYIADGGKISIGPRAVFMLNEAVEGAAIYAEKLSSGDLIIPKAEFMNNAASGGGTISFGGELELSDAEFYDAAQGNALIENINKTSTIDKAIISSVSFANNTNKGKGIVLTNVRNGSKVEKITGTNNELDSLIEFNNVTSGNRIYVTNVTEVTANTFDGAAIAFNNVEDVVLNNVTIDGNTSSGFGAMLINGSDTKVHSVGELKITNNTNTGNYGAAITILDKANLEEDGGLTVTGNRSNQGGAIYLDGTMGVESQGSKPLKVSVNYINNTNDTKNIYVLNENAYVYATGRLSDDTQLGFTAGGVNVTAFKYWNSSYISKIGSTDKFTYTPENCGMFLVDTLSVNAKQELYKSGLGNDIVIKLGANFTKLRFVSADKKTEYLTQNIERGVNTKLDQVLVEKTTEKWIAPNKQSASDYKWQFNRSDIIANYDTSEEYIYKLFTYSIVYTGGSKGGSRTYNNIEYGEAVYAIENPFAGDGFKSWKLRNAISGLPREYAVGDMIKNICQTDGGVAYLDARWSGEVWVKIDPNAERYGLNIAYNAIYDLYGNANSGIRLSATYPYSLGGSYNSYSYNLKPDGSGTSYSVGSTASFKDDVTLYLIWGRSSRPRDDRGGGGPGGGGGGGGGGARVSGGTIRPEDLLTGPGVEMDKQQPFIINIDGFTVDEYGNIRDKDNNIVGNIYIGDRVNPDGSFTAVNGITVYPNGAIVDPFGNIYNPDGSITTVTGNTYFVNGDVMDPTGAIYHADGSITLPNGVVKDADGIIHYPDGSITLPDGTTYLVDGTTISPGGIQVNQLGEIIPAENEINQDTPGAWNYDPASNNWKFEITNEDGSKITYKDQWIRTKNMQGESTWFTVDKDGNMITGWLKSEGEYFFMSTNPNSRGEMVKGTVTIDGKSYTFDADTGALISGEVPTSNLNVLGAVNHESGKDGTWKKYDTGESYFVTYFIMPDGSILEVPPSGWYMIDGRYYFFDEYGIPKTGLLVFDEKYYYFNNDGTMLEGGEVVIDGTTYVFDKATGACRTMRLN